MVTTEFKDKAGDPPKEEPPKEEPKEEMRGSEPSADLSVNKRPSHSDSYSSHRVHVMEKTKDMLAALVLFRRYFVVYNFM